jgi:ornithine carbamoyltransferase
MTKHLLSLKNWFRHDIDGVLKLAGKIKKKPRKFENKLRRKNLLMMFAKPSLRTHLSFDIAMHQLGGHAIFYDLSHSVLGKKESIKDFSKVVSRYVDIVMARLYKHRDLEELAEWSDIPVINGLTNYFHPCQILGDFLTIKEKLRSVKGRTICFLGDADNNVTHSLIEAGSKMGVKIVVSCPNNKMFLPNTDAIGRLGYRYEKDPNKAVRDADVIYTDSWMSYHIPKSQEKRRIKMLRRYRVDKKLFSVNSGALFMHCLPAVRGMEVTDDVMDSKRSIVYDQAENRLNVEKAILLKVLN